MKIENGENSISISRAGICENENCDNCNFSVKFKSGKNFFRFQIIVHFEYFWNENFSTEINSLENFSIFLKTFFGFYFAIDDDAELEKIINFRELEIDKKIAAIKFTDFLAAVKKK